MDNFSTEFKLECIKREIQTLSRDELEQKISDLFTLVQKQSEHIQVLNLLINNLEKKCALLSTMLATMLVRFNEF